MNEPNHNVGLDDATENGDSDFVLVFDEEELEEDGWTPDPVDKEIAAYLDDEMTPDEREAFELKVKNSKTLQEKLDAERSAWNALDLLEVEKPRHNLTESTLGRLNEETRSELRKIGDRAKRFRLAFYAAAALGACAFFAFGYALFARFFPDIEQRRRQDCQVVDRLEQLGAVDNFDYLRALAEAKLFAPPEVGVTGNESAQNANQRSDAGFFLQDFKPQPKKTYEELSQDRAFYRRQLQFESLDENEKQKYRDLYRLVESSTNAEALWTTANAYAFWLATAVNDSEIDELQEMPIPKRIETIRGRQEFFKRMREFYSRSRPSNFSGSRATVDDRRQERDSGALGTSSPTALAVRLTLPEDLRNENLAPIYRQYEDFRRQRGASAQNDSRQLGVFTFLTETDGEKLLDLLSEKAREYLRGQSEADRASALGLLVMLSFLENNGADNRAAGQNGNRQTQGGSRRPYGDAEFDGSRWGRRWRFERNDFAPQSQNTVENLAKTLREAPSGAKSYIVSNAPQAAMAALLGLHWNSERRQGNNSRERGSRTFETQPLPNPGSVPNPAPRNGFAPPNSRPFNTQPLSAPGSVPKTTPQNGFAASNVRSSGSSAPSNPATNQPSP